jgi:hypothetical protein
MSMIPQDNSLNGYYDDKGHWHSFKKCFMWCGSSCDCLPPDGMYYDPAKDKRKKEADYELDTVQ